MANDSSELAAPALIRRRKVVLCGFFGRGNAGDEAFLRVQHDLLAPHFDVAIAVEAAGAQRHFRSWYPYRDAEVWSFDEVNRIYDPDVVALNVGGGSLPFASHGHFLLSAFDTGKKTAMTGIDASAKSGTVGGSMRREIYGRLDYFSVRHERSYRNLQEAGIAVKRGADWALGLKPENRNDQAVDVVVTMRGFAQPGEAHVANLRALEARMARLGRRLTYLPFAPDDRDFLSFCGVPGWQSIELWHDPAALLDVVSRASLVISIGRLHTLIFALVAGVPCLAIDPGIVHDGRPIPNRKNMYFCEELGLPFYGSVDAFLEQSGDLGPPMFPPRSFPTDYLDRYRVMADDVLSLMLSGELAPSREERRQARAGTRRG